MDRRNGLFTHAFSESSSKTHGKNGLARRDTVEALRRLALKGTEWAQAQVDTIRLKLFKIGALIRISARRVWLELSSTYPWKQIHARAFDALRC